MSPSRPEPLRAALTAIDRIEKCYDFYDEKQALTQCVEWQDLKAALAGFQAPSGWQPIETVPLNRRVVVWMPDGSFSTARYGSLSEPRALYWMIPSSPFASTEPT